MFKGIPFPGSLDAAMMDSQLWHEKHNKLMKELNQYSPRALEKALETAKKRAKTD